MEKKQQVLYFKEEPDLYEKFKAAIEDLPWWKKIILNGFFFSFETLACLAKVITGEKWPVKFQSALENFSAAF